MSDASQFNEQLAAWLSGSLASGHLWVALLAAAVGGFLTSLTPCVYPLIPITVRYFGGKKAVLPSAVMYVAGMTLLYAALGTAFASLKMVFGTFLANPWVLLAIAAFCAAMGASMLGAFTLQLPAALNTRLSRVGGHSLGGAFAMGLVSALIAAPCTGPVLAVILTVIAATGAVFLGFWLMVAFGLGLGLPFLLLALFAGRLPKGGVWMEAVKTILSSAMFIVAIYFAQIALPSFGSLLRAVPWLVGVVLLIVGALLLSRFKVATVGLLTLGGAFALLGGSVHEGNSNAPPITWVKSHDEGLALAKSNQKPAIIDFTAEWCQACQELERETYVHERVRDEAQRFVNIKIDATEMNDQVNALFEKYAVLGLPTVVFVDSQGGVMSDPKVTGFVPPERFAELMTRVR